MFENLDPDLKTRPLGIQQKQIIVTCNYPARDRGLHKLQLVSEAKKLCPDLVIRNGENLTPFRETSKILFRFLSGFVWNKKCERLGLDECWVDVSDIIAYNIDRINASNPRQSFFYLDRDRPERGFSYDASSITGNISPTDDRVFRAPTVATHEAETSLELRLKLGSHLAQHIRQLMLREKGFTATVGISTNKLLSKLVGNVCKPDGQTTLLPPYQGGTIGEGSNVSKFLDFYEIGQIPGIGFKTSNDLKREFLGRDPVLCEDLVYGRPLEFVSVGQIRRNLSFSRILNATSRPGSRRGLAPDVLNWIHGRDDAEVRSIAVLPSQISIEDSYLHMDTYAAVQAELISLGKKLINRMRLDLADSSPGTALVAKESTSAVSHAQPGLHWLAVPRTLRLSTRQRLSIGPGGDHERSFRRISRTTRLPSFILRPGDVENIAQRMVDECLLPLFRQLHSGHSGWDLSLVNVAGELIFLQQCTSYWSWPESSESCPQGRIIE